MGSSGSGRISDYPGSSKGRGVRAAAEEKVNHLKIAVAARLP
jgi:hypothetical protein